MDIAVLMGRGIEGTGNTKYAIEFSEYLSSVGDDVVVLANKDKKWNREEAMENKIVSVSYSEEYDKVKEACLSKDHIVIISVPAKNFPEESKDAFMSLLKAVHAAGKKVSYFQLDHKIHSINRNMYAEGKYSDFFSYVDIVITHSKNGDFAQKFGHLVSNLVTASSAPALPTEAEQLSLFFPVEKKEVKSYNLNGINGLDYDKYKKYWKPFSEKEHRTIKFIGRSAAWKGPYLFAQLHAQYLKQLGFIASCEGIEKSLGSLQYLYDQIEPVKILKPYIDLPEQTKALYNSINDNTFNYERDHICYMLPPYDNAYAMDRMSRCQFGIELLLLPDHMLADIMEYAMMEMVAVGTVPVFRKHWAEMFAIDGKPLIEYGEDTGTVFLDEEHPQEAIDLLCELSDNEELYTKYRENAFNFYSKYLKTSAIYGKLREII